MKKGGVFIGGFVFLFGFVIFSFIVLKPLMDSWSMQSWQSVKGQLVSAKVDSERRRKDNNNFATFYKLNVNYQYRVAGRDYVGDRVNIENDANDYSSNQSEHARLLSKLNNEQQQQRGITVWYDPESPSDSVYNRNLNWHALLIMTMGISVFMLLGGGIVMASLSGSEKSLKIENSDPKKPWKAYKPWASPLIYSEAKSSLKLSWFVTALATLFFGSISLGSFGQGSFVTLFTLSLLLIPGLLAKRALRIQREWNRFQKVPLELDPYPGIIGGCVGGSLELPASSENDQYTVKLICTKHWRSNSSNSNSAHQSIVWSSQQNAKIIPGINSTKIQFSFDVPAEQSPSTKPDNNYHRWSVEIIGKSQDTKFDRTYEIPVFITQESQTVQEELEENPLSFTQKKAIEERLTITSLGKQISLETPGSTVGLFIAGIGGTFSVIGIVLAVIFGQLFGILFALVGSIFLALGLWIVGRNCKVLVTPEYFDIQVLLFSFKISHHKIPVSDVHSIKIIRSSSGSMNGVDIGDKFDFEIKHSIDKILNIGGNFNSVKNATHMKLQLEEYLK